MKLSRYAYINLSLKAYQDGTPMAITIFFQPSERRRGAMDISISAARKQYTGLPDKPKRAEKAA
jgi:hypothetical protein